MTTKLLEGLKQHLRWRWLIAFILIGGPVVTGIFKWQHKHALVVALIVLVAFWALVLVFLEWAGSNDKNPARSKYGFVDVVIGSDGRVSTSQTVVYAWTFVFASALIIMTSLVIFGSLSPDRAFTTGSNWDAYLLLLGGPFASAVIAKGIVSYQTEQDPSSKSGTSATSGTANTMSTTTDADPSVTDIVNGDSGAPSLVDTQYSIFSLIAMLYFIGVFVANLNKYTPAKASTSTAWLPQIPSALLGLTSLAALTYVGNKAVQTQGLRVVSFSPNPAPVGNAVTATLVNLPKAATPADTTITFKDAVGAVTTQGAVGVDPIARTVQFQAPATAGTYAVTITGPGSLAASATLVVQ